MTAYCAQSDVENKVGGTAALVALTDINNTGASTVNATVLNAAIESASATIDAYINKAVLVPLAVVPPVIKHLAARLAAYELRAAKRNVDPETHGKVYEDDIKMLDAIKSGDITLGVDPAPLKPSARIDAQSDRSTTKPRSRLNLRGFS